MSKWPHSERLPKRGEVWVRKKDGTPVGIMNHPSSKWAMVGLEWPNGRRTSKQMHYFLDEFEPHTEAQP